MTDFSSLAADVHAIREALDAAPRPPAPPPVDPHLAPITVVSCTTEPKGTSDHNPVRYVLEQAGVQWISKQCNVQGTDPLHDVATHAAAVWADADEVAWNEIHTEEQAAAIEALPDSIFIRQGQLAVSLRTSVFRVLTHSWEEANGGILHVTPVRGNLAVLAEHRDTDGWHWRECDHVVQHIEVNGKARVTGQITGQNARGKHHIALIAASTITHTRGGQLAAESLGVVRRLLGRPDYAADAPVITIRRPAPTFGSGDLNVDYIADRRQVLADNGTDWFPYTVFTNAGLTIVVPVKDGKVQGTHGARCIDQGWLLNS